MKTKDKMEFVRKRDQRPPKDIKTKIGQLFCNHYWRAKEANPYTPVRYDAKCLKCGKKSHVMGQKIDEIEEIVWRV